MRKNRSRGSDAEKGVLPQFREMCAKAGIRATHQRLEVLREIVCATDHPTVDDVYRRVRKRVPSISLDTVYRTLATFEKHDVVRRLQVLEDPVRYDGRGTRHHHLVCTRCGCITDLEWPAFDGVGLPRAAARWGTVKTKQVQLEGLCAKCLQAERAKGRA